MRRLVERVERQPPACIGEGIVPCFLCLMCADQEFQHAREELAKVLALKELPLIPVRTVRQSEASQEVVSIERRGRGRTCKPLRIRPPFRPLRRVLPLRAPQNAGYPTRGRRAPISKGCPQRRARCRARALPRADGASDGAVPAPRGRRHQATARRRACHVPGGVRSPRGTSAMQTHGEAEARSAGRRAPTVVRPAPGASVLPSRPSADLSGGGRHRRGRTTASSAWCATSPRLS